MTAMEEAIKDFARTLGFPLCGIAPATAADGFDRLTDWLDRGYAGEMAYMHRHHAARRHPDSILATVRNVIMVGMEYSASGGRQSPEPFQYEVVPFDQIISSVASGKFDAGLIIHEGQLTFQNDGLRLIVDLGVWWQEKTGLPLPLGGNVVRRDLGDEAVREVSRLLKESIRYALAHRADALKYALQYARDMDTALADQFVGMYVNEWTLDYGPRGREAVQRLLTEGHRAGVIPHPVTVTFAD